MKIRLTIACMLLPALAVAADPRAHMKAGAEKFQRGQFAEAAEAFRLAAETAGQKQLDPAVARFNRGVALFRQGDYEQALQAFLEAAVTTDLDLQALAYYNAACARLRQFEVALERQEGASLERYLAEAVAFLDRSLLLKPDQADARHQLEYVLSLQESLALALVRLEEALGRAETLIAQHRFEEAHALLLQVGQAAGPALLLPRADKPRFDRLLERTGQIVQILKGSESPGAQP